MVKKFGTFMFIVLILCAVLMLLATDVQESYRTPETDTTGTTAPVETTAPVAATDPTVPAAATEPTAPAAETTPPAQTEPEVQADPAADAKSRVEQILNQDPPARTAATRRVHEPGFHSSGDTSGLAGQAYAYALAEEAQEREMNPIAGFWKLVSAGLYAKQTDPAGKLEVTAFTPPAQEAKVYDYTAKGAQQMLTDWLNLAARMEDGLNLELALLGADLAVEKDQVFESQAEKCRYAYFTCTSDRATYILCVYLRGGKTINDAEFQLLAMGHASGEAAAVTELDTAADRQAANLMAAAELLLTGTTKASQGNVPSAYEIGGYAAETERFHFIAEQEDGTLTNYRLRAK